MKSDVIPAEFCPCGSNMAFNECCKPLLDGRRSASTAEQLMRSRYSAYVVCDEKYLRASWHPDSCPDVIDVCQDQVSWLGLKIRHTEDGNEKDTTALVEFVARYKIAGRAYRLHEISRFVRYDGRWVYQDGRLIEK